IYSFDEELLGLVFRTFADAFPERQLWWLDAGNVVLLGSQNPIVGDVERVRRLLDRPFLFERRRRSILQSPDQLFARCLLGTAGLTELAKTGPIHSDDRPLLELEAPRTLFRDYGRMGARLVEAKRASRAEAPTRGTPPRGEALVFGLADM